MKQSYSSEETILDEKLRDEVCESEQHDGGVRNVLYVRGLVDQGEVLDGGDAREHEDEGAPAECAAETDDGADAREVDGHEAHTHKHKDVHNQGLPSGTRRNWVC